MSSAALSTGLHGSSRSSTHSKSRSSSARSSGSAIVHDRRGGHSYTKGRLLGKGGFAKCYELTDVETGTVFAGKIVEKRTLAKYRAKEKLTTEIKIHNSLANKQVVGFHRFFEDPTCVYILLEVCESQTMMELHKRRRTLTEPETRFYLKQIVEGTIYMHSRKVIHRDLKLGNLFLDKDLQVKIGDFGLATTVEFEGERKKTLCGTPNYIAPEILDRKSGGHSYEVDVWSIGCIMYTLLFGRPPFETSNIDSTYQRIRKNEYKMSSSANVSQPARDLVRWMLAASPRDRPTVDQILTHPFFEGYTPSSLPRSALTKIPAFPDAPASSMSAPSRALSSVRKPLGAVDVNSPAMTGGKSKAAYKKSSAPVGSASASSGKKYTQSVATAEKDHTLPAVLAAIQKCVAEQGKATATALPIKVSAATAESSVWISKWVDYSNKYGLGYQLSDGSVGVLFNDSTKMVLSSDKAKIESIERSSSGYLVTHLTLGDYPAGLTKKVTLLKYFQNYMNKNLLSGGNSSSAPSPTKAGGAEVAPADMMHVKKWTRTKEAIVFRLSHGVIQLNFFDHAKLVFNCPLGLITFIDKTRETNTFRIDDIAATNTSDEVVADLIGRLPYAAEVVEKMIR